MAEPVFGGQAAALRLHNRPHADTSFVGVSEVFGGVSSIATTLSPMQRDTAALTAGPAQQQRNSGGDGSIAPVPSMVMSRVSNSGARSAEAAVPAASGPAHPIGRTEPERQIAPKVATRAAALIRPAATDGASSSNGPYQPPSLAAAGASRNAAEPALPIVGNKRPRSVTQAPVLTPQPPNTVQQHPQPQQPFISQLMTSDLMDSRVVDVRAALRLGALEDNGCFNDTGGGQENGGANAGGTGLNTSTAGDDDETNVAVAEIDYCGREIQQLVASFVRRQSTNTKRMARQLQSEKIRTAAIGDEIRRECQQALADVEASKGKEIQHLKSTIAELRGQVVAHDGLRACMQSELDVKNTTIRSQTHQIASLEAKLEEMSRQLSAAITSVQEREKQRALHVMTNSVPSRTAIASASPPPRCPPAAAGEHTPTVDGMVVPGVPVPVSEPKPAVRCVVISGFKSSEKVALERMLDKLGAVMAPPFGADEPLPPHVTHVVAGSVTTKVVCAMLTQGVTIVSRDYIARCATAGEWLALTAADGVRGDPFRFSRTIVLPPGSKTSDAGYIEMYSLLRKLGYSLVVSNGPADEHDDDRTTLHQLLDDVQPFFLKRVVL